VVGHLNRGIDEMPDPSERAKLAELNVRAGEKARNSAAYDVATASFRTALLLRGFDEDHELAYGASSKLAESYYLSADPEKALEVIDRTITHTRSVHERGELEALRVTVHLTAGDMLAAVACGREAARLVGIDLPSDPAELGRAVEREIGIVLGWLAGGPIERLFDLPPMQDPQKIVSMTILMNCIPPAYQTDTTLMALLCAKTVTLSLEHGNCATSARGYCSFAILLHAMGQDDAAYVFAKAGVELNRRRGEPALESAVQFLFGTFVSPWKRPIEESLECLRAGFARGLETGDYPHMAYSASVGIAYALTKGAPLAELESSAESFRKLCEELGENVNAKMLAWNLEFIRDLRGTDPRHPTSAERKEADERTLATLRAARNNSQEFHFQAQRLERCYLFGDYAAAVAIAAESEPLRPTATGFLTTTHHHYYSGLALLAGEPAMERSALESKLDACERELARRRDGCPENFGAMYLLFAAERARSSGDAHQATDLYDRAIAEASEHGLLNHEALANERAGRFWLSRKKPEFAAIYVRRAMALYVLWGADAKARMLENEHRELVVFAAPVRAQTTHTVGATTARDALDLATVVKAGRAISGEIVLDRLLGVMTDIIVENAGARMGAVVLEEDGAWLVQAARDQTSGETSVMKGELLSETEKISAGVVNYVLRTGESVVVDDARVHGVFASDPYVRSKKPKSVLCTPIRHKSRVMGALYLENGLVAGAFTAARLEALEILASQLAVSIENARLFAREKEQADAIAKVNDHLEELVAERTKELSDANRKLRDESAARERAEVELRLAQKLQSVGQLAAGVAHEINTPMQFVGDNLEFVREAFEDLIELVDAYRAARPHISDEQIAGALLRAEEDADLEYLRVHVAGATDRALEGVRRVSGIVRAMKAFSHPDRTEKTAVDVNAAIENTLVVAHNEYKLVADVVTELGAIPTVLGHGGELSQVLLNLVVNAAHAIEDVVRGTENKGTIRVASRLEDDAILVTVSDSGGGIPESIRERIFDPFFTTKDVGRGTGQGLAIARSAVERHGGRIWFESETGRGTTFVLRLPLDAETATRAA
jgi:signal transduction histidine kinase